MKKKKFVAMVTLILAISVFPGCSASGNNSSSKNVKYNVALISNFGELPKTSHTTIDFTTYDESKPNNTGEQIHAKDDTPVWTIRSINEYTYAYPISSWEYGDSDTIILYLMNGNIIQTSSENVLLYYDPNY